MFGLSSLLLLLRVLFFFSFSWKTQVITVVLSFYLIGQHWRYYSQPMVKKKKKEYDFLPSFFN